LKNTPEVLKLIEQSKCGLCGMSLLNKGHPQISAAPETKKIIAMALYIVSRPVCL